MKEKILFILTCLLILILNGCSYFIWTDKTNEYNLLNTSWYWYEGSLENDYTAVVDFTDQNTIKTTFPFDDESIVIDGEYSIDGDLLVIRYHRFRAGDVDSPMIGDLIEKKFEFRLIYNKSYKYALVDENDDTFIMMNKAE